LIASPFDGIVPSDVPVTVAWLRRDLVLPTWGAREARRLLPQATHLMIRGAGHVPMWDAPEQVADIILRGCGALPTAAALPSAS
jgi:pimeloyl-ACP methyl ester carboxylesterase